MQIIKCNDKWIKRRTCLVRYVIKIVLDQSIEKLCDTGGIKHRALHHTTVSLIIFIEPHNVECFIGCFFFFFLNPFFVSKETLVMDRLFVDDK